MYFSRDLKMMKKGEKNEFLVVLKDTLIERSTFLYVQLQENKTLLHFSPEFHAIYISICSIAGK
ncbi:hypothetical protein EfmAA242_17020 [Enterococcus faecium]|nr:hypothetical protein EfmAA242_17020 [Enterococcus faecium]